MPIVFVAPCFACGEEYDVTNELYRCGDSQLRCSMCYALYVNGEEGFN